MTVNNIALANLISPLLDHKFMILEQKQLNI